MGKHIELVKCPLCGTHKPIRRTGIGRVLRGKTADYTWEFRFDHIDLNKSAFISIRDCQGRGGLPEVERITLQEAIDSNSYPLLRESLYHQCLAILKILKK